MSDDFSTDDEFPETHGIWWAGIVFSSIVTFGFIGGLLIAGIYVPKDLGYVDLSYWVPTVAAAILTGILVTVALKRGEFMYEPQ